MKHDYTSATNSAVMFIKNYFEAMSQGNLDLAEDDLTMLKQLWWELNNDLGKTKTETLGN